MELSPLQMDPAPNPTCSDWKEAGFAIGASRVTLPRLSSAFAHRKPCQRSRRNEPDVTAPRHADADILRQELAFGGSANRRRRAKRYPATRTDERSGCSFPSVIHDQLGHYNPKHTAHYTCVAGLASRVSGDRGRRRRHRPSFARVVGVAPPDGQAELRQSLIEAKPLSHGRRSTARLRVTNS